jgi:hypothetical protein
MSMSERVPTDALIVRLRRAASIWFKNDDLLLLEELIRRFAKAEKDLEDSRRRVEC